MVKNLYNKLQKRYKIEDLDYEIIIDFENMKLFIITKYNNKFIDDDIITRLLEMH